MIKIPTRIYAGISWHDLVTSVKLIGLFFMPVSFVLVIFFADLHVPGRNTFVPVQTGCIPWNKLTFFLADNFVGLRRMRKVGSLPALFLNKTEIVTCSED